MPATGSTSVVRHGILFRATHWALFIEGVLLTLTGLQLGGFPYIVIFLTNNLSYHIMLGVAFIATGTLFIYDMAITNDYRWVALQRIPYSLKFILAETRGWFGIAQKPGDPILYSESRREYKEKLVPSVILVFWTFILIGALLALTGLALAYPSLFFFVYWTADPLGSVFTHSTGIAFMLALHRLITFLLVAFVAMHIYATFLFGLVRSMIGGKRNEPAIE